MSLPFNEVISGDCVQILKEFPDCCVDEVVTDPPYGIGFMGKNWDKALPSKEAFEQIFRVLKPGALAFVMSSPRQDVLWRMLSMLEGCGFQLKQSFVSWIYKSGFPKAYDVSKGIDKMAKRQNLELQKLAEFIREKRKEKNISLSEFDRLVFDGSTKASWVEGRRKRIYPPTLKEWKRIKNILKIESCAWDKKIEDWWSGVNRFKIGEDEHWGKNGVLPWHGQEWDLTKPSTDLAKKWEGWKGQKSLKPALECVLMVNKPFSEKTIVDNVLKHGVGAINVDTCRIPLNSELIQCQPCNYTGNFTTPLKERKERPREYTSKGRFPANLLISSGALDSGKIEKSKSGGNPTNVKCHSWMGEKTSTQVYHDVGGQSRYFDLDAWAKHHGIEFSEEDNRVLGELWNRFFDAHMEDGVCMVDVGYFWDCMRETLKVIRPDLVGLAALLFDVAKASKSERNMGLNGLPKRFKTQNRNPEDNGGIQDRIHGKVAKKNFHPTVKPIKLMAYLVELGCPEGGLVLDPFCGSGSTLIAAHRLNRKWIGIEVDSKYAEITRHRLSVLNQKLTQFMDVEEMFVEAKNAK